MSVRKKGLSSLIQFSEVRGNKRLTEYLSNASRSDPVLVHATCRKMYTDPRRISVTSGEVDAPCQKRLRSTPGVKGQFDWKKDCFFCGHLACYDEKHPNRNPVCRVETLPFVEKIAEQCAQRNDS